MAGILAWFWNERFWLPHNVTWADLKNTDEATFPQAEDLYLACPLAFCIFMIRLVFERWVRSASADGFSHSVPTPLFALRVMGRCAIPPNNGILSGEPADQHRGRSSCRLQGLQQCALSASSRRVLPARSPVTELTQHRANDRGLCILSFYAVILISACSSAI